MAEFTDLGDHCEEPDCKQIDFLPFLCSHCKLTFCQHHFQPTHHSCTRKDNVLTEDELAAVEGWTCELKGCNQREAVRMPCESCSIHFCLSHRHKDQHSCSSIVPTNKEELLAKWEAPRAQYQKANSELDKQLANNLRSSRNKERAAKVQLMKLKSRAALAKKGLEIPLKERVHFLIHGPSDNSNGVSRSESVLVVSSSWSLGRVLDAAAECVSAVNSNNKPNTPQLRFFNEDLSAVANHELHLSVSSLFDKCILHDGQTLILNYI